MCLECECLIMLFCVVYTSAQSFVCFSKVIYFLMVYLIICLRKCTINVNILLNIFSKMSNSIFGDVF